MRIVLDLQACQGAGNRVRGIGRYARLLAQAMLRESRGHEFIVALNGGLPDAVEEVRANFDGLLAQDRILAWDNPFPAAEIHEPDPWRCRVAELLREDFLGSLRPDVVHVASLFEGWIDPAATSIGRGSAPPPPTAVTLYDLIPLAMHSVYLQDGPTRRAYERKLEDLRRADLCLAISEFTRQQGMELLGLPNDRVVNISGSVDPVFTRLPPDPRRADLLAARYDIWRPFVMYTGGFDSRKNVAGLLRAYAALPALLRETRQLVIVGQPPPDLHAELSGLARASGLGADEVRFTGFVPDADLVALYNACQLYVFPSLMEGFGLPALEAMACGAPVISADVSSLPEVIGYPESMFAPGSDPAMRDKIEQALLDEAFRQRLIDHGAERFRLFSWENSARRTLDALEALVRRRASPSAGPEPAVGGDAHDEQARWQALSRQSKALSPLIGQRPFDANARRRLAAAQSENLPPPRPGRQLLVDVSNLSRHDAGTGIQRVVRNIVRQLFDADTRGLQVVPVRFDDAGVARQALEFTERLLGVPGSLRPDPVLDARPGDVFLGLDLSAHIVPWHYESFDRLRRRGVEMHFVVYDLIPWLRPDCVDPGGVPTLQAWYRSIGTLADGLCCISRAVSDDMQRWCDQVRPARLRPLGIGHFHLGSDLDAGAADATSSTFDLGFLGGRRSFLMVSTIEPRKGYAQALDAFEQLWDAGVDANLVIVGKLGWMMDALATRLRAHPEAGRRLHWLERVDDAGLRALYAASAALVVASEAEGFGLPIVEAARQGLPVIARDLPVFLEVAGAQACYFSGHAGSDLAAAVQRWIELDQAGRVPSPGDIACMDWRQSTQALLRLLLDQAWDARWLPGSRHWYPANDPRLGRQVGDFEREQRVTDGRGGFLVFGPYLALAAGRWSLRLAGDWLDPGSASAWLDVVTHKGMRQLVHRELLPAQSIPGLLAELDFELDAEAADLEVRLWVSPGTRLRMQSLAIEPAP